MTENEMKRPEMPFSIYLGEEGLERLFQEYNPQLAKVVAPLAPNSAVLDDILQDVWLKVYKALPGFKAKSSLFTWLYRIAVNTAFTALKKIQYPTDEKVFENLRSSSEPDKEYEKQVLRRNITASLNKIGSRYREVFLLRAFEEMSFKEIGDKLSLTENNARVTYFYAVKKMREHLKDHYPIGLKGVES